MSVPDPGPDQDPRIIPVAGDEERGPGVLEVGGEVIARGGLVVLPTDPLYGVGCDPFNASAVDALFQAKQRGRDLPLPVLVHTWRQAIGLVDEVTDQAQALIAAWWPGPLTLAVPSPNRSGQPTPNEVPAVVEQLGAHVGVFFDAGPAPEGPASSIVDL